MSELRALMRLATPVALGHLALMGIGVTDVIVAGRAGVSDLAGVTLGSNVWVIIIYFFFGISMANQPLIAGFFGKRDFTQLRAQFHQSLWMSLLTGVAAILTVLIGVYLLGFHSAEPEARAIAMNYLGIMALGAMSMTILPVLRTTLEAMNQTRLVLYINLTAFLINIPVDFALVLGLWGLPKLGGVGCAWASVFVLWLSVFATWLALVFTSKKRSLGLARRFNKPDFKTIFATLKLGVPIGFSILIEVAFFGGAAIVIASLGEIAVASHAVAISAASLSYMIYFGIGQAITILGAQRIGHGRPRRAVKGIYFGIWVTLVLSVLFSILIVVFRAQIAGLYTGNEEVILLASSLLIWSALFQLGDATQITVVCGLRAFKETASPPRYQFVAFWLIGFPVGYLLAVKGIWPVMAGPHGFWLAMTLSLFVVAILLFAKLRSYTRKYA